MDIRINPSTIGNRYVLGRADRDIRNVTGSLRIDNFAEDIISKYEKPETFDLPNAELELLKRPELPEALADIQELINNILLINKSHTDVENALFRSISIENIILRCNMLFSKLEAGNEYKNIVQGLENIYKTQINQPQENTVQEVKRRTPAQKKKTEKELVRQIETVLHKGGIRSNELVERIMTPADKEVRTEREELIRQPEYIPLNVTPLSQWKSPEAKSFFWRVQRLEKNDRELVLKSLGNISISRLEKILSGMDRETWIKYSSGIADRIRYYIDNTEVRETENAIRIAEPVATENMYRQLLEILGDEESLSPEFLLDEKEKLIRFLEKEDSSTERVRAEVIRILRDIHREKVLGTADGYKKIIRKEAAEIRSEIVKLLLPKLRLEKGKVTESQILEILGNEEQLTPELLSAKKEVLIKFLEQEGITNKRLLSEVNRVIDKVRSEALITTEKTAAVEKPEQVEETAERIYREKIETLLENIEAMDISEFMTLRNRILDNTSGLPRDIAGRLLENLQFKKGEISETELMFEKLNFVSLLKKMQTEKFEERITAKEKRQIRDTQDRIINRLIEEISGMDITEYTVLHEKIRENMQDLPQDVAERLLPDLKTEDTEMTEEAMEADRENVLAFLKKTQSEGGYYSELLQSDILKAFEYRFRSRKDATEIAETTMNLSAEEWQQFTIELKKLTAKSELSRRYLQAVQEAEDAAKNPDREIIGIEGADDTKIMSPEMRKQMEASREKMLFITQLEKAVKEGVDIFREEELLAENTVFSKFVYRHDNTDEITEFLSNKPETRSLVDYLTRNNMKTLTEIIVSRVREREIREEQLKREILQIQQSEKQRTNKIETLLEEKEFIYPDIRIRKIKSSMEPMLEEMLEEGPDKGSVEIAITFLEKQRDARTGEVEPQETEVIDAPFSMIQMHNQQAASREEIADIKRSADDTRRILEENTREIRYIKNNTEKKEVTNENSTDIKTLFEKFSVQENEIEKIKKLQDQLIREEKSDSYYTQKTITKVNDQLRKERLRRGF